MSPKPVRRITGLMGAKDTQVHTETLQQGLHPEHQRRPLKHRSPGASLPPNDGFRDIIAWATACLETLPASVSRPRLLALTGHLTPELGLYRPLYPIYVPGHRSGAEAMEALCAKHNNCSQPLHGLAPSIHAGCTLGR